MDVSATLTLGIDTFMCQELSFILFSMAQTINKLAGQELLDFVNGNQLMNKRELCLGAGYFKDLDDGTHGPNYIAFYESILEARQANGEYKVQTTGEYYEVNGRDWYEDVLTEEGRELYDMIEDRCPEFSKLDAEQCQEFMQLLDDIGITTAEQFEDAYYYQTDSWNAERDFAQYYAEEIACLDVTNDAGMGSFLVIDWQATWDCNLRYDFNTIEFDGETYFFHNI